MVKDRKNTVFNVKEAQVGDKIFYYNTTVDGDFILDVGEVREDNLYEDGIEVCGDGWKQYISKFFIARVERNNVVIFEQQED